MKPSHVKAALTTLVAARKPAFIWGPPGVGKSDIVRQVAEEQNRRLVDIRAVLLDPVDLRGLPRFSDNGTTSWATPDFLPRDGEGILFLDELNAAPPMVQTACYQLVLDRKIGDYELPEGWDVVAAGNREVDRAGAMRMPSALANRFTHLEFEADLDDWCLWAARHGIRPEIIAFLRFRPECLDAFNRDEKAFPTPRSWSFASDILNAGPDDSIELPLYEGVVGKGAAVELFAFLKVFRSLPSPDAILLNPANADVPDDPATLYALASALSRKAAAPNLDALVTYADRIPAEYAVFLMKTAVARDPGLQHLGAFNRWAAAHGDILT
ncbi:MAG: MoxR family ATPase [Pseudomonadota bacterium]